MTDQELLKAYLQNDAEAFRRLVQRHMPMVYHTAARQVGYHNAEDITQAVFALLANRAEKIPTKASVAGWLHEATRYCCQNFRRSETRRHKYELKAAMQKPPVTVPAENPHELREVLDEALGRLNTREREAVLLRYLENKSVEETASALAIEPAAAAKRALRGLNKLRALLKRRGVVMSAVMVTGALVAESAKAAPAFLREPSAIAPGSQSANAAAQHLGGAFNHGTYHILHWRNVVKVAASVGIVIGLSLIMIASVNAWVKSAHARAAEKGSQEEWVDDGTSVGREMAEQKKREHMPLSGAAIKPGTDTPEATLALLRQEAGKNHLRAVRAMFLTSNDSESLVADALSAAAISLESLMRDAERRYTTAKVRMQLDPALSMLNMAMRQRWDVNGEVATAGDGLMSRMVWRNGRWQIDLRTKTSGGELPDSIMNNKSNLMAMIQAIEQTHDDMNEGKFATAQDVADAIRRHGKMIVVPNQN